MPAPIGKVTLDELRGFLIRHGEYWKVDAGLGFQEFITRIPMSVDEFIGAVALYSGNADHAYVFSDDDGPYETASMHSFADAPLIDADALEEYVIRSGRGDDFLYVACSEEDAANGTPVTLLPGELVEEVEEIEEPEDAFRGGISGIDIENFKGIKDRIELELKPITLLFGPNSAGKSSILQALHYAAEIFNRHNTDADQTISGGEFVNLGGFATLVHAHDLDKTVWLRIELSDKGSLLPEGDSTILDICLDSINSVKKSAVEIGVRWDPLHSRPFVETYRLYLADEFFAEVKSDAGAKRVYISRLNVNHRQMCAMGEFEEDYPELVATLGHDMNESCLAAYMRKSVDFFQRITGSVPETETQESPLLLLEDQPSALPRPGQRHMVAFKDAYSRELFDVAEVFIEDPEEKELYVYSKELADFLSRVLTAPIDLVREQLAAFRYLGPIRILPPRNFVAKKSRDHSGGHDRERWPSGLGAWDALFRQGDALIPQVNKWLADKERLDTGYEIQLKNFKELDLSDPLVVKLLNRRMLDDDSYIDLDHLPTATRLIVLPTDTDIELEPADVGIGISQLVPVVVTALDEAETLSLIEQPELHLHPRIQAELGDLFIEGAKSKGQRFLIETHSEHLILRLLRRIRETESGKAPVNRQLRTDDLAIYYLKQENGSSHALRIDVDVKGEFIQPWPDDFFEIDFYERFA